MPDRGLLRLRKGYSVSFMVAVIYYILFVAIKLYSLINIAPVRVDILSIMLYIALTFPVIYFVELASSQVRMKPHYKILIMGILYLGIMNLFANISQPLHFADTGISTAAEDGGGRGAYIYFFFHLMYFVILLMYVSNVKFRYDHQQVEEKYLQLLDKFLGPEARERIKRDTGEGFGREKKIMTVLFINLREFTALSEKYSTGKMLEVLEEYWVDMTNIILKHGGTIDKFIGNGIMGFFSDIPEQADSPDKPRSAVRAALDMQKTMSQLKLIWAKRQQPILRAGIGINTGEVIAGMLGDTERMTYTIVGDTISIASRLSGMAKEGEVLVTGSVMDSVSDYVETEPVEPSADDLKKLKVYRVKSAKKSG